MFIPNGWDVPSNFSKLYGHPVYMTTMNNTYYIFPVLLLNYNNTLQICKTKNDICCDTLIPVMEDSMYLMVRNKNI